MANEVKETPAVPVAPISGDQISLTEVQGETSDFLERNQKTILLVVGLLVAIAAGIFLFKKFVTEPKQAAASEMMWKAQQMFERDSFALALSNPAPGYLGFLDIADEYGSTSAGNLANYYAGISYLQLGQYDAAIDYLQSFGEDGSILPATKSGALGDAHAQKGDLSAAEGYYQTAVSEAGDNTLLAPYYLFKLAMFRESQGNNAAANELYKRIQMEFPNSSEAQDIEKYLMRTAG